jgi:D-galactarolactone cycloisomerase
MAIITEVSTEILADAANPQLLVHVATDDGLTGVGETWWGTYQPSAAPGTPVVPIASMVDAILAPLCVGCDADDIAAVSEMLLAATYQYGDEGIVRTAVSGIDLALWDLAGKRIGCPVTELLGPTVREFVPVYASLHWLGDLDRVVIDASRAIRAGISRIKLHEADPLLVAGARAALGPEVEIMVDASARIPVAEAAAVARAMHASAVTWLEEPIFPQRDHATLARVRAESPVPIAAGENEFSLDGFGRLLEANAVDILQPELAKCGGLTPTGAIAGLAEQHGIPICPHNFSLGPSFLANVHWAFATGGVQWIELPWLPEGQAFPSGMEPPTLVDGCVLKPTSPGLGYAA